MLQCLRLEVRTERRRCQAQPARRLNERLIRVDVPRQTVAWLIAQPGEHRIRASHAAAKNAYALATSPCSSGCRPAPTVVPDLDAAAPVRRLRVRSGQTPALRESASSPDRRAPY